MKNLEEPRPMIHAAARNPPMPPTRLDVGDCMRISVELIRDFAQLPDLSSPIVRLREVRLEADGTKTLYLDRMDDPIEGADMATAPNPNPPKAPNPTPPSPPPSTPSPNPNPPVTHPQS